MSNRSISNDLLVLLNTMFVAFFAMTSGLFGYEMLYYIVKPDEYRFGTEVSGWVYISPLHYLGSLMALLAISVSGVLIGGFLRQRRLAVSLRGLLFIIIMGAFLYGYLSND